MKISFEQKPEEKPKTEYPAKLYVRPQRINRYPGDDETYLIGQPSVRPQLYGDTQTEIAIYQLVRVAKFQRVITEVLENDDTTFKRLTTEVVKEID